MKKLIFKSLILVSVLGLFFLLFFGINTYASTHKNSVNINGKDFEILNDEMYGCYESIAECVKNLDPPLDDEVFMDDTPWSFLLEVDKNWWYSSCYYYKVDGPVKNNYSYIQPENVVELKNQTEATEYRIKNFASSVALDSVNKRLAVTLSGPHEGNNGQIKLIFKAPKSGWIVIYNEGLIEGATPDSPFKAFSELKASGYVRLSIQRNGKNISDFIEVSHDNMTEQLPIVSETGKLKVSKGDQIIIHIKSFENLSENNTIFIDPVIAYTELIDDKQNIEINVTEPVNKICNNNYYLPAVLGTVIIAVLTLVVIIVKKVKKPISNNREDGTKD